MADWVFDRASGSTPWVEEVRVLGRSQSTDINRSPFMACSSRIQQYISGYLERGASERMKAFL